MIWSGSATHPETERAADNQNIHRAHDKYWVSLWTTASRKGEARSLEPYPRLQATQLGFKTYEKGPSSGDQRTRSEQVVPDATHEML